MRRGELLNARWTDVSFETRTTISFNDQWERLSIGLQEIYLAGAIDSLSTITVPPLLPPPYFAKQDSPTHSFNGIFETLMDTRSQDTIRGPCKHISVTATFSTGCAAPNCRRRDLRTSGGLRAAFGGKADLALASQNDCF